MSSTGVNVAGEDVQEGRGAGVRPLFTAGKPVTAVTSSVGACDGAVVSNKVVGNSVGVVVVSTVGCSVCGTVVAAEGA